jgi:AraC-like DNA-binding protein
MLLAFSILGVILSAILLIFNARKNTANLYLGGFFFLVSLYVFAQYVLLYSKSIALVTGILVSLSIYLPLLYLGGPLLYWYVRSVIRDNARINPRDLLHLLPLFIFFVASLPLTFSPLSEKIETATQVVNNVGIIETFDPTFLSQVFPNIVVYLSRPVLLLAYTVASGILIARHFSKRSNHVFPAQSFMIKWLIVLTGLVVLLTISHTLQIIQGFVQHFSAQSFRLNIIRIIAGLGLIGFMIFPFMFPAILYGLPRVPPAQNDKLPETGNVTGGDTRKSHRHYEDVYLNTIGKSLDQYMDNYKPFLQPGFNLNQLSVLIEVPAHHLACYFRDVKNQTFSEYRNSWRVEYAKSLIRQGKTNELTLEAIASLSGFSNRNAFRSVFKKTEGICPNTFALQTKHTP